MEGDKAAEWAGALDSEFKGLWENEVLEEVDWPQERK